MVKMKFPDMNEGVAVVVDLDKCIGCRACQIACQEWNGRTPIKTQFSPTFTNPQRLEANAWKVVFFKELQATKRIALQEAQATLETVEVVPVPYNCLHCVEAPCAKACPVGAIKASPEGAIVIEASECIGCGYCLAACPYDVPRRGSDGKYYKCTFCVDRIQAKLEPACVSVCPTEVFTFTSMSEAVKIAEKVKEDGRKVYGLSLDSYVGGRVRWIFVASKDKADRVFPAMFPEIPRNSNIIREYLNNIGLPGLGLLSLIALAILVLSWIRAKRASKH
ncbi:MAG: 4Fe-4S dicluster domain-containing protein [Acidilobaceae archaeon]